MPPRGAGRAPALAAGQRGSAGRNRRGRIAEAGQEESGRRGRVSRPPRVLVAAEVWRRSRGQVAAELLQVVEDEKADLIVAGGYGHSRLGEWIFGGVTRELLTASPVCCMLSH